MALILRHATVFEKLDERTSGGCKRAHERDRHPVPYRWRRQMRFKERQRVRGFFRHGEQMPARELKKLPTAPYTDVSRGIEVFRFGFHPAADYTRCGGVVKPVKPRALPSDEESSW